MITEFGHALAAKSVVTVSRVEHTKLSGGHSIACTHVGANVFPRLAYRADSYWQYISVHKADGQPREEEDDPLPQDIAGPMCFAGDYLAKERMLPRIRAGDVVMLHDTGAVTMSHYNYFNCIPAPAVYAYGRPVDSSVTSGDDDTSQLPKLELIKRALTQDDINRFWE